MRKSREEAAATRERIVDAAAREFRQNGIAETGLNDLMRAAGLTHGGFYKHFESKDQVVDEAIKRSFEQTLGDMESSTEGKTPKAALSTLITKYLSTNHRELRRRGLPFVLPGYRLAPSGQTYRRHHHRRLKGGYRVSGETDHECLSRRGKEASSRDRGGDGRRSSAVSHCEQCSFIRDDPSRNEKAHS